jgi:hypothetical protein
MSLPQKLEDAQSLEENPVFCNPGLRFSYLDRLATSGDDPVEVDNCIVHITGAIVLLAQPVRFTRDGVKPWSGIVG